MILCQRRPCAARRPRGYPARWTACALERASLAYGELRAQVARHEIAGKQALEHAVQVKVRTHDRLRELGEARQHPA